MLLHTESAVTKRRFHKNRVYNEDFEKSNTFTLDEGSVYSNPLSIDLDSNFQNKVQEVSEVPDEAKEFIISKNNELGENFKVNPVHKNFESIEKDSWTFLGRKKSNHYNDLKDYEMAVHYIDAPKQENIDKLLQNQMSRQELVETVFGKEKLLGPKENPHIINYYNTSEKGQ